MNLDKKIIESKDAFSSFDSKTFEEVEDLASNVLKEVSTQVRNVASGTLQLIKKNPVIALSAAVTLGLVIAKLMSKSESDSKRITH